MSNRTAEEKQRRINEWNWSSKGTRKKLLLDSDPTMQDKSYAKLIERMAEKKYVDLTPAQQSMVEDL